MVFQNFFKKLFGPNEEVKTEKKEERVSFEKLSEWIQTKQEEITKEEKKISVHLKEKITSFVADLNEKIPALEDIDLNSINSEKRINAIVKAGINNYTSHVKSLSDNLEKITGADANNSLGEIVNRIFELFSDFNKKTVINYQRAAFLVGKELTDIHDLIVEFSKFFTKIVNDNKNVIDSSKVLSDIKKRSEDISKIDESIDEITVRIKSLNNKISIIKERKSKLSEDIENLKKSDSFIENQRKTEDVSLKEKELLDEIYKLKQSIDFKALGNIYHGIAKKMEIVKEFRDDFESSFKKDNGDEIITLLNESKLNTFEIDSQIEKIVKLRHKLNEEKSQLKKDETKDFFSKIKDCELELNSSGEEKEKEIERKKKLESNKDEIFEYMKEELLKIDVKLI